MKSRAKDRKEESSVDELDQLIPHQWVGHLPMVHITVVVDYTVLSHFRSFLCHMVNTTGALDYTVLSHFCPSLCHMFTIVCVCVCVRVCACVCVRMHMRVCEK